MATKEQTGAQVYTQPSNNVLNTPVQVSTYKLYQAMRKDPTLALGRAMVKAPIVSSAWSFESRDDAPEGAKDFIKDCLDPMRLHILRTAIEGHIDYGWAGYEKVFALDSHKKVVLKKLKPLLQTITEVLVDEDTGAYLGLRQANVKDGDVVNLSTDESLCITIDYEGTNWYGRALLENAVDPYNKWNAIEAAAARYDKKVAGTHWVVYYPIGSTKLNGVPTDNYIIAKAILDSCESSGKMVIPSTIEQMVDELDGMKNGAWKVELVTDGSSGRNAFTEREKYLDTLKIRGLELPERSILEGQFGTKAEAETHGDFAITNLELKHQMIVEVCNWHVVNQLLRLNWGASAENTVWIASSPIANGQREYLKGIYDKLLTNPEVSAEEFDVIDRLAIRDQLNIPTKTQEETVEGDGAPLSLPLLDPNFKINLAPVGFSV